MYNNTINKNKNLMSMDRLTDQNLDSGAFFKTFYPLIKIKFILHEKKLNTCQWSIYVTIPTLIEKKLHLQESQGSVRLNAQMPHNSKFKTEIE